MSLTMMLFSWHHLGVEHTFDPQHKFVSSPLVSPSVLAGIRLVFALYALGTICTDLGFNVNSGDGKRCVVAMSCSASNGLIRVHTQLSELFHESLLHRTRRLLLGRRRADTLLRTV